MDSIIHADIFFFVSTIALILISIGVIIALVYLIKLLRDVTYVSRRVREESDEILNDVKELRTHIKSGGFRFKYVTAFLGSLFKMRKNKKSKEQSKE